VFLAPAFGLDGSSFRELAPAFADRRAFAWNPSNRLSGQHGLPGLANDAVEAAVACGIHEPAVWIGSSFGGMIALQAALDHPDRVAGLVLIGTSPSWRALHWRTRALRWLQPFVGRRRYHKLLARIMIPGDDAPRLVALRAQMERRTKGYVSEVLGALHHGGGFDLTPRLGALTPPTLVLHGERDAVSPLATSRSLMDAPGVDFQVLADRGHLPYVFHPEEIVASLRSFLPQVDARLRA
jgi:pimeloyl-ACP methyl ester carboxylesterase